MSGGFRIGELCAASSNGVDTANSRGTAVVAGSSAYSSYVQLVASTTQDTSWAILTLNTNGPSNNGNGCKFQLAVGGAGSEVVIVPDIPYSNGGGGYNPRVYSFPISIPAGSRVAIAAYETGHTDTFYADITLFDSGFVEQGVAGYNAIGISGDHGTSVTAGAANTKGSYAQLAASTANDYCGFLIVTDTLDLANVGGLDPRILIDIAIGAGGSEQIIVPNFQSVVAIASPGASDFIPIQIPAGTRIAARLQNNAGTGSVGVSLLGAYP